MIPLISDYYLEEFDLNFPLKKKLISYALENRDNSLFEELIPLNNLLLNEPSIQIDQSELIRFYVQKITKPQLAKIKKYQSYHHDGQKIERQPSNESLDFFTLYPESLNDFTNSSSCFNLSHQELDFKPDNLLQDVRVAQISKTICDAKQTIVMVSRHVVDERGQVVKNNFRVNLDQAVISDSDDNQHIYNITAGTVHIGDSWHSGHYKSFLKVSKDQQELWVCYNDSSIEIVDSSKLNANGIPIELEEKCYFLQYSRSGVELAKFEEISAFGNAGNHCWLNSATVFMQSFEDFRNFVKSLSNEEHSEIDLDLFQALKRFKQETEEEREKAKRETSPSLEVQSSKMPLIEAVNEKNKELVEAILFSISEKSKAEFVDKQESDGTTALHLAVLKDDIEIANILLKNGANIYITDKHGNSPLSLAFEHKRTNFISAYKELIKLDIAKTPKQTIQLAKGNEITRTPDLLTSNISDAHPSDLILVTTTLNDLTRYKNERFFYDTTYGYHYNEEKDTIRSSQAVETIPTPIKIIRDVAKKPQAPQPIPEKENIFILACKKTDDAELIELMVTKKLFDINSVGPKGRSGLMEAIAWGNTNVALKLIELGADVNICENPIIDDVQEILYEYSSQSIHKEKKVTESSFLTKIPSIVEDFERDFFGIHEDKTSEKKSKVSNIDTALILAVLKDNNGSHLEIFKALINNPETNFNTPGDDLKTILHIAVENKKYLLVEALVCSKICEIDAQNIYGETALHIAASNLDFEMIKILRKYGASNQYKNNHGNTAVDNFRNAVNKSEEEKKITQKPDSINSTEITLRNPQLNEYLDLLLIDSDNSFLKDKNGNYLNQNCKFFDVVKKNSYDNLSEVSDLIKETSVNIVDSNNMSLLHYSIINENYDVFELLLKSNANIFVKNNLGEDPVGLAIRLDKIDMVKAMAKRKNMVPNSVFINDSSSTPPFLIAFNTNNEDMFKFLMTYFLDNIGKITSNKTNKVRLGFIEIIETILESNNEKMKEIFLNHRNDKGQSIVHLACKNNCQDIVEKFLKKGVGFDCRDNDNKTPLELAIENNHSSIIEILQPKESPRTSPSIAGTNPRSSSPRQIS